MKSWLLDMLAIVVGVILAELVIDAIHRRQGQGSMLDGNG